jgi:hypothetical protein
MKFAVAVLALLALAAPVASARPVEQFLDPDTACERQWVSTYGTPAPSSCEDQVLASRGSGGPAEVTASAAPSLPSTDSGFDWGAAAAGAGVAGALALAGWSVLALSRRRVRTARP